MLRKDWNGNSVSDPDSIRSVDPNPDPGAQKLPTKIEVKKFHVLVIKIPGSRLGQNPDRYFA